MSDPFRVLAGESTVVCSEGEPRERHGHLLTLVKPDGTVLVHDGDGYQPAAWLTRPESTAIEEADGPTVTARDGDRALRVHVHDERASVRAPASAAGAPVGPCPDCGAVDEGDGGGADDDTAGTLVRADGAVTCVDCGARYGLPAGARLLAEPCDCGLPRMEVERGHDFELCVDRACESLDDAVAEAFDGAWDCPDCGAALEIRRARSLIAGCERYPDCETAFRVPDGVVAGTCGCGLPAFAAGDASAEGDAGAGDARCLDATCDRPVASTEPGSARQPPSG